MDFMIDADLEEMIVCGRRDGLENRTDEEGRFELTGLVDRDYSVLAMHPVTLGVTPVQSVAAGVRHLTLVLGEDEPTRRVAGRVVTTAGEPVVEALIRVNRRIATWDGERTFKSAPHDFHAKTGSDGTFVFESLAVDGTSLLLNGEGIPSPQTLELALLADLEHADFRVPSECHLRVILESNPEWASSFELLDESGERLNVSFMRGSVTLGGNAVGIAAGESALTRTDDSARTIVLFGPDGLEVHRQSIRLDAGEVNELRF
jgi:hypothetical protein